MRSWTLLVVFPDFQESFVRQGTCRKDTGRDWRRHGPKVMPNVDPVRWWATRCHSLASESVQKGGAPTIWREVWEWLKMANTKSSFNHMQKGLYYHVAGETHYVIRRLSKQNLPQQSIHWSSESCVFLQPLCPTVTCRTLPKLIRWRTTLGPFSLVFASKAASPKCRRYLATNLSNVQSKETTRNYEELVQNGTSDRPNIFTICIACLLNSETTSQHRHI